MNTDWSDHVQGINTLYTSRELRFHDLFKDRYLPIFSLPNDRPLRILEIGCGPGALAQALKRWYPQSEIVGIDRDTAFIEYARAHVSDVCFLEGDATQLPFADGTFDVTISNTVSEHIEPKAFYGEQMRVLKPDGICIVISGRRGYHHMAPCLDENEYEQAFWKKVQQHDHSMETYHICQYPLNEMEHPKVMAAHGFRNITTGYALIDLTPDDPKYSCEIALKMIESGRGNDLDAVHSALKSLPEHISREEAEQMTAIINEKYNRRISLYLAGEKQWNTYVSIALIIRGTK